MSCSRLRARLSDTSTPQPCRRRPARRRRAPAGGVRSLPQLRVGGRLRGATELLKGCSSAPPPRPPARPPQLARLVLNSDAHRRRPARPDAGRSRVPTSPGAKPQAAFFVYVFTVVSLCLVCCKYCITCCLCLFRLPSRGRPGRSSRPRRARARSRARRSACRRSSYGART